MFLKVSVNFNLNPLTAVQEGMTGKDLAWTQFVVCPAISLIFFQNGVLVLEIQRDKNGILAMSISESYFVSAILDRLSRGHFALKR